MLTIDTNNKAWLKYVGQNTGSSWTVLNGTEMSAVPQVRLFHLDVFSINKIDFRFEFPLAIPPAQTAHEEINIGSQSQSPVLEEIQVLPDLKETSQTNISSLDLNVDEKEKSQNTACEKSGSQKEEILHIAEISHICDQVKIELNQRDVDEIDEKKIKNEKEEETEIMERSEEDVDQKKLQKENEEETEIMERSVEDVDQKKLQKENEDETEKSVKEPKNSCRTSKTHKRSRSVSEPIQRKKMRISRDVWKSKTWESYWTPTSGKRLRQRKFFKK